MDRDEQRFLEQAVAHLEFPSFLARFTNLIGKPIELGISALPAPARGWLESGSRTAIEKAFQAALSTLPRDPSHLPFGQAVARTGQSGVLHAAGSALSGAIGGFFGLPALVAELPVSTGIILRSMAAVASHFGEDLRERRIQLEVLTLFSYGGPVPGDDALESSYFTARLASSRLVDAAAKFAAGKSWRELVRAVQQRSAPALVDLVVKVAARFEIVVGEKAMAQLLPGIGAGTGAALNIAFSEHFHSVARAHFGIKRLEREYGAADVRRRYDDTLRRLRAERGRP